MKKRYYLMNGRPVVVPTAIDEYRGVTLSDFARESINWEATGAGKLLYKPSFVSSKKYQIVLENINGKKCVKINNDVVTYPQSLVAPDLAKELTQHANELVWSGKVRLPFRYQLETQDFQRTEYTCYNYNGHDYTRVNKGRDTRWYLNDTLSGFVNDAGHVECDQILLGIDCKRVFAKSGLGKGEVDLYACDEFMNNEFFFDLYLKNHMQKLSQFCGDNIKNNSQNFSKNS